VAVLVREGEGGWERSEGGGRGGERTGWRGKDHGLGRAAEEKS